MMANQLEVLDMSAFRVPEAQAQGTRALTTFDNSHKKLGLIAIVVEEDLMQNAVLREGIITYAQNAQRRIDHSRAVILETAANESPFTIATTLERLYFEGVDSDVIDNNALNNDDIDEDNNQLIGAVFIGDLPMPVVTESDGSTHPSLYPYTDFHHKRYLYNLGTERFEVNEEVSTPNPEIWHGLITPPSKDPSTARTQLMEFFEKNAAYSEGDPDYADFNQRLLYANYPAMEKQANLTNYQNYKRYLKYMEEILVFHRYNKHLLKPFIREVSDDLNSEEPIMSNEDIDAMNDVYTKYEFEPYMEPFSKAVDVYLGKAKDVIAYTGRWDEGDSDTPETLVAMRDTYMQGQLTRYQILLERAIDDSIARYSENMNVLEKGDMTITVTVLNVAPVSTTIPFPAYVDGQKIQDVTTLNECGMMRGQYRRAEQDVLDNNSVYVEANRLYDSDSFIEPPNDEDWKLKEDREYRDYGGCVSNNSEEMPEEDLGPSNCVPKNSYKNLFSYAGSNEVKTDIPADNGMMRCAEERFDFKPREVNDFTENIFWDASVVGTAGSGVEVLGIGFGGVPPGVYNPPLKEVVNEVYSRLSDVEPAETLVERSTEVVKVLGKNGGSVTYSPAPLTEVTVTVALTEKSVDATIRHVEPTNEAIADIKDIGQPRAVNGVLNPPTMSAPSIPADGIRSTMFLRDGTFRTFNYPNLFDVPGTTPEEIERNLQTLIAVKEAELSSRLGVTSSTIREFFVDNADAVEPLIWKQLSIDQKLRDVVTKYVDRDSFMPTLGLIPPRYPQEKPEDGYEVIHVRAKGDTLGYQFGLNRIMDQKEERAKENAQGENALDGSSLDDLLGAGGENNDNSGTDFGSNDFICGDPAGVEIWEWFDAIQCWINEEILPAEQLFNLDYACTEVADQSDEEADAEAEEDIRPNPFDVIPLTPARLKVTMNRQSLGLNPQQDGGVGQEDELFIEPVQSDGQRLIGYIDDPVHIDLSNPDVVALSKNDFYLFSGEARVKVTAKNTGTTTATVTVGDLPPVTLTINVYERIDVEWASEETIQNGRSTFKIDLQLTDPNGNPINNVNAEMVVASTEPANGGFTNNGKVQITEGKGSTVFVPIPGRPEIFLVSRDPFYQSEPYAIYPTPGPPVKLLIRAPHYIALDTQSSVQFLAVDAFNFLSENFNQTIRVVIQDKTTNEERTIPVTMRNGQGSLQVKASKEAGDLLINATHPDLQGDEILVPMLARMDSERWGQTYPQNFFASFVGFPAGDFLQENYFAGTHLFSGKTEAVFAFMSEPLPPPLVSITPNFKISLTQPSQKVYVGFEDNALLLQAFDQERLETLFSKTIALDFDQIETWENPEGVKANTLYVQVNNPNYTLQKNNTSWRLLDDQNNVVLQMFKDRISVTDPLYHFTYNDQSPFDLPHLLFMNDLGDTVAELFLAFPAESLSENSFNGITTRVEYKRTLAGNSTKDPTGMMFYNPDDLPEDDGLDEYFGLRNDNQYISLFASGSPVGDAVRFNLPTDGVLLGDPTIKLPVRSTSSLNYNYSPGRKVYQDHLNSQIISINHFNFNRDIYQDIVMLTEDGRVRLMEGGPTDPRYKDRGDIAFMADGAISVEGIDFKKDSYEDVLVATEEGRLAIMHNEDEVITRTDQKINVGTKLYTILAEDMDMDGYEDLVTLDSRGDIRIFYYDPEAEAFPTNGQLIDNFGFKLATNNLASDIKVRYPGLEPPNTPADNVNNAQAGNFDDALSGGGGVSESEAQAFWDSMAEEAEEAREDPAAYAQNGGAPLLPWGEGDETQTYFEPVTETPFLTVNKTVENLTRPGSRNVDLGERLKYTLQITSNSNRNNVVLADTIPDALLLDPTTIVCAPNCEDMAVNPNGTIVFLSNLNPRANQTMTITYEADVEHTPRAAIIVQTLTKPAFLNDAYTDILVSPPYNPTNNLIQLYSTAPRTYAKRTTEGDNPPTEGDSTIDDLMGSLDEMGNLNPDRNADIGDIPVIPGMEDALDQVTGNNECFESADNTQGCAEALLDDIAGEIADFSCSGSGCFPMPWNYAFLVPPQTGFPILAFPTTLPTPVGPMPFLWPGSFLGAAAIPGPIMSLFRLYLSPTLTGGLAMAICWGPYMGSATAPPPLVPIPYPPPIGNCMVIPLPNPLGALCKEIENQMTKLTDAISSGISKIDSTMTDINNNSGLPVNLQRANSEGGAGGLEVSLGVNLGNSMKYEPPVNAFSNIHIPTFDSIQGVISGWFDRQTTEITQKLLTLPTFTVYLPDFDNLFSLDWDRTLRQFTAWKNTMTKSATATGKSLDRINEAPAPYDGKFLGRMDAIEKQVSIYNLNAVQGLYDIVSTIPFVNLTERPIDFRIPWLSAAEIQAYIQEMERWLLYYDREWDRIEDKWEAISCEDQSDANDAGEVFGNSANCFARQIADRFMVDFSEVERSVQENIASLQAWLALPKQLVKFKQELADYVYSVACYLEIIANLLGGWNATIREQLISWAEVILTIVEVVKNIQDLFDVFIDFDSSCATCTNHRFANFGWWTLLGLILPDIPIFRFPKLPDVVADFSNLDGAINLDLPILNISPLPLPLPPLPFFTFPDFPDLNLMLSLPPLPLIPRPPALPELPDLPPLPTIDLPTLPPPPKLPDVGASFEAIIPIVEQVLNIWCLIKKSLTPVPESMLNDHISTITARPAYLTPLDIIKVQLPDIAAFDLGFNEFRIETLIYLGLRITVVADSLEESAKTWNEWMQEVPNTMEKAYQEYITDKEALVQGYLDDFEAWIDEGAETLESKANEGMNNVFSEYWNALEKAEQWRQDQEAAWNQWAEEFGSDWTYDDYVRAVQNANRSVNEWKGKARETVDNFFEENRDYIHVLNYLAPLGLELAGLKALEKSMGESIGDRIQKILDKSAEGLNTALSVGPAAIYELFDDIKACAKDEAKCDESNKNFSMAPAPSTPPAQTMVSVQNPTPYAASAMEEDYGNQLQDLFAQIGEIIEQVNQAELVDYTVVKERLDVPDFIIPEGETFVDELVKMRKDLLAESQRMHEEAKSLANAKDLTAFAKVPPQHNSPYKLAAEETVSQPAAQARTFPEPKPQKSSPYNPELDFSNQSMELQQKTEGAIKAMGETTESATTPCSAGLCLPDLISGNGVPVVPYIRARSTSQALFMPEGHLVYNDGTGLYLKDDLTVPKDSNNTDRQSIRRIKLNDNFLRQINQVPLRESINMLKTTLTENGNSSFTWKPTTSTRVYGYGMEIERSILGFDESRRENGHTDTTVILLPKENGETPKVIANGKRVVYDTLITSLNDAEEAKAKFGIGAGNVITNANSVNFVTVNNVTIDLHDNYAIYFDQFTGTSHSISMANGYYHVRMSWFDRQANVSTRTQSELFSPQLYAAASPPVDIAADRIFYMPVYKEKTIRADEVFVDFSGAYNYYWFVDGNEEYEEGNRLLLLPHDRPEEFTVRVVATQDIEDDEFESFEKTFKVVVYVPPIELDTAALQNGVVKGKLVNIPQAPSDDLSDIPFSVFRKRWDTWKNLGLLVVGAGRETTPPLNDSEGKKYVYEDSYYSQFPPGGYSISDFTTDNPSPIVMKDTNGDLIARINPVSGEIELFSEDYELAALPASNEFPTRVAVVEKATELLAGNVYYMANPRDPVKIVATPLTNADLRPVGVTAGDANSSDDIIARNIPNEGPSFPGGIAIFNQTPPQKNVALVDRDGTIRLMQTGYKLALKDTFAGGGRYIFQIVTESGVPIFDIYIHADFEKMNLMQSEVMDDAGIRIGLNESVGIFASLIAQTPSVPAPLSQQSTIPLHSTENPFPDLNAAHPYYKEIIELYKSRVVSGYGDGTFRPDSKLARAEFVKIALGVTNCYDCTTPTEPQRKKYTPFAPFPDVKLPAWYYFCISIAKELGMVTGYGDGFFRPDRNISRAEAAAILLRQSNLELTPAPDGAFFDVQDYAWYKDDVYTAVEIGLIKNNFGYVLPDEEITRGEFAFMAKGVMDLQQCKEVDEDRDGLPDWWEMENNMDPLFGGDALTDIDFDGLTALEEFRRGTDPNQGDTDGDGLLDSKDPNPTGIDLNGDGVIDERDGSTIPNEEEEKDSDGDGLPDDVDTDDDNDGVPDDEEEEVEEETPFCPCVDNPNQNDTDLDDIIDTCDDDIDNDTVPNPICIFDDDGNIDEEAIDPENTDEPIDNCIFDRNQDQADGDLDGVGDECEEEDLCPAIPEDLDGVDDSDGCPEVDDDWPDTPPGTYVNKGPACKFLDYEADLVSGDEVMTAITDIPTHEVIYSQSNTAEYNP